MQNKMVYLYTLVLLCYVSTACSNHPTERKNNNPSEESSASATTVSNASSTKTVAENIKGDTSNTVLTTALESTDLMETLTKSGPFTVFAPSNNAFKQLPDGILDAWMSSRKNDLANILSYHIVAGFINTKDMKDGQKLKTLAGEELIVTMRTKKLMINGNSIISDGIESSNGIVYLIDGVLFPRNQNPGIY